MKIQIDSFTDEQLLNLVNNTITEKTEFSPNDFSGGSVILTTTHNNTIKKYKVSLYFGYKGKHPINRQIEISEGLYFIWAKAIMVKVFSLNVQAVGMDINELNSLMQDRKNDESSNSNSNSNLSNSSIDTGDTTVPTTVPTKSEEAITVANYLLTKIIDNKPNFICKNIQAWIDDVDKAIRIDKRSKAELIGCIDWIYTNPKGAFWMPNILSGKKLREKFDTMEAQMMASGGKNEQALKNLQMIEDKYNEN